MPPKIVVLLDWDGTCANSMDEIALYNRTLSYMERLYPEYKNLQRLPEDKIYDGGFRKLLPTQLKKEHVKIAWTYLIANQLDNFDHVEHAELLPGVRETLERLHAREDVSLAVLSNRYAPSLHNTVKHLGLEDTFAAVEGHTPRTSDFKPGNNNIEGGYKIYPSSMSRVIEGLRNQGALDEDSIIVMVGDSPSDVNMRKFMKGANFAAVTVGDQEILQKTQRADGVLTPEERDAAAVGDGSIYSSTWAYIPSIDKLPEALDHFAEVVELKETPSLAVEDKGRKAQASDEPDAGQVVYDPTAGYLSTQAAEPALSTPVGIDPEVIPEYPHKRSGRLPDIITFARHSSETFAEPDSLSDFRIATTGQRRDAGDKLRPIYSPNTQIESTVPVVRDMMAQHDFVNKLLGMLKASGLHRGETVALCYPWAEESPNKVPIVSATLLEKEIAADPELQALDVKVLATPVSQSTTDVRDGLPPFQQLAVRPAFDASILRSHQPVKAICVGENALSASTTEMAYAVAGEAEVVAVAATSAYDVSEQLTLRPEVRDALVEGIKANTNSQDDEPVEDFENVLKRLGYVNGIESMTNIEAMLILSTLYDRDEGLERISSLWSQLNPEETLAQASARMQANGMQKHLLIRSCEQGKRSFVHELQGLIAYARTGKPLEPLQEAAKAPLVSGATGTVAVVAPEAGEVVADARVEGSRNKASGQGGGASMGGK